MPLPCLSTVSRSSATLLTGFLFTSTITSPRSNPASAAGLPSWTFWTPGPGSRARPAAGRGPGYGVGYGLGDWIERLRRAVGLKEDVALFAAILALAGVVFIAMAWTRRQQAVDPSAP